MRILLATEKPFAAEAVDGIRGIVEGAGYTLVIGSLNDVSDADGLIVRSDSVTEDVIAAAPQLKIVVRAGAGYDNVDISTCTQRGIIVMNTPGQNSNAVAELALGLAVFMARNCFTPGTGTELKGKVLGIHAYGNVGRLVAQLGKGFGMKIMAFDPFVNKGEGVEFVSSAEELYKKSDYVSLHIPATPATRGSIGYDLLMSMPKGGTLINTARKEVIDEAGLERALSERGDLKYATDNAPDTSGWAEKFGKRFFATAKKMGAETAEANVNAGLASARQIVDFFETGNVTCKVN